MAEEEGYVMDITATPGGGDHCCLLKLKQDLLRLEAALLPESISDDFNRCVCGGGAMLPP